MVIERVGGRDLATGFVLLFSKLSSGRYEPRDPEEELKLRYEVSSRLITKLRRVLKGQELERFLEAVNKPPLFGFRVNTLKASVKEVLEELRREGDGPRSQSLRTHGSEVQRTVQLQWF